MLAEGRRVAHHPSGSAAFVLDPVRALQPPRSPLRSPRLMDGRKSASSTTSASAHRPGSRPVFDFVRTTTGGGRPLSLPYAVDAMRRVSGDDLQAPTPFVVDPMRLRERPDAAVGIAYLVDWQGQGPPGLAERRRSPLPLPLPYLPVESERRSSPSSSIAMDSPSMARSRPSPPSSLLDSLSLTEDQSSLIESPRLTPVSSILDTSSLARLQRRRGNDGELSLLDSAWNQGAAGLPAIKRGVLWQQRERLWSRWKERYFVLTSDYLHCFKRRAAADGLSQMGHFIFKVRLVDLEAVEWLNRRSYSVVALSTRDGPRVLLRAVQGQAADQEDGLEDWFELLEECTLSSKERRRALYQRGVPGPGQGQGQVQGHQPSPWTNSLREGSLTPRLEFLLRRRQERTEHRELPEQAEPWTMQRSTLLAEDEELPPAPSASGTYRSGSMAAPRQRPPPRIALPQSPAPLPEHPQPGPGPGPGQPLYHRMNHDVFFMAADRSIGDNLSWSSRSDYMHHRHRHTQV